MDGDCEARRRVVPAAQLGIGGIRAATQPQCRGFACSTEMMSPVRHPDEGDRHGIFSTFIYMRIRLYVPHDYETTRKGCVWFEGWFFHHPGETLANVTSILSSDLESELRDGAEYSPELDQLMRKARKASNFLKALSHENRLLLLCLLAERERSVTELENILSLRQSAVSQQLARLRYDGMVDTRRDGKTIYYSLANEDVRRVISVVYDIFCAPVTATDKK